MKRVLPFILAAALVLPSCSNGTTARLSFSRAGSVGTSSAKRQETQKAPLTVVCQDGQNGFAAKDGFYFIISSGDKTNTEGQGYYQIRYLDYATKQDIVLCNKPNCAHNSDTCNAYLDAYMSSGQLFEADGNFYLLNGDSFDSEHFYVTDPYQIPGIYRMDNDGANRTKILSFGSGVQVSSPLLLRGHTLYVTSTTTKGVPVSGVPRSYSTVQQDSSLMAVDLDLKTTKTICSLKNRQVLGAYGNLVVMEQVTSKENLGSLNGDTEQQAYEKQKVSVVTRNIDTGKETTSYSAQRDEIDLAQVYGNSVYYVDTKDNSIRGLNLDTNKVRDIVTSLPKNISIVNILDNRLIYACWENKKVNPGISSYFWADLKTGEKKRMTLFIQHPSDIINILAETGNQFLVISGHNSKRDYYKDPSTKQSVEQDDVTKTYYSLMNKDDFWNSKANYKVFTEEN